VVLGLYFDADDSLIKTFFKMPNYPTALSLGRLQFTCYPIESRCSVHQPNIYISYFDSQIKIVLNLTGKPSKTKSWILSNYPASLRIQMMGSTTRFRLKLLWQPYEAISQNAAKTNPNQSWWISTLLPLHAYWCWDQKRDLDLNAVDSLRKFVARFPTLKILTFQVSDINLDELFNTRRTIEWTPTSTFDNLMEARFYKPFKTTKIHLPWTYGDKKIVRLPVCA